MVSSRRLDRVALATLAVLLVGGPARSQEHVGKLAGIVRDTSGAPLAGVSVTITTAATGAQRTVTTAADGAFSADLPAGVYSVSAALRGFRRETRTALELGGGSSVTADFTLSPQLSEEVTVTAMRREQAVTDVPFSIAAPTEDVLRERGAEDIEDVAANVAGFTVQNLGPGQSQVAMRGVSAGQVVRDQPGVKEQVGAYLDDSIVSMSLFTPDIDLFDVSRVEVLRGPQGTLFGAGSLSGTVRYITRQPELRRKELFTEFGASALPKGTPGAHLKLGGNLPLGESAALRALGYYTALPGFIDAVHFTTQQPDFVVEHDVNTGRRRGVRATLAIAPSERLTITPRVLVQGVEMDGWNRVDAYNILANDFTTTRPFVRLTDDQQYLQVDEPFTDRFLLGDVSLRYDFGPVALASITSYTKRDIDVVRDAGALTASITGGTIGLPEPVYTLHAPLTDATEATSFTEELRLSGGGQRFQWVAGGFYGRTDRDYGQTLLVAGFQRLTGIQTRGLLAPTDVLFYSDLAYDLRQVALFGEGTLRLADRLSVTGGLRWYDFREERAQVFDGLFGNDETGRSLVSQPGSTDASGIAPRLILSFDAGRDVRLNAQVSRGFRLGGINDPLNVPLCTPDDLGTFGNRDTWTDETAWNYELGAKSRLPGGRGAFSLALFNMEIRDLQATVTAGSCSSRVVFNVPTARSRGVEAELSFVPSQSFELSFSGSWNDAQLTSTVTSTSRTGAVSPISGIQAGNRLPTVPELQFAAAARYQWRVAQGALSYLSATWQHQGSRFTQIGDQAPGFGTVDLLALPHTIGAPLTASTFTFDPELPAYDIVSLRWGFVRQSWEAAVYVNNVFNERALLALDQERGRLARVGYLVNPPATMGFMFRVNF